jgi:hypothetical protein
MEKHLPNSNSIVTPVLPVQELSYFSASTTTGTLRLAVRTILFRTEDGGETWNLDSDESIRREGILLEGVRSLGTRLILAFGRKVGEGSNNQGILFYSTDVGKHWRRYDMPSWLNDCEQSEGDLICTELVDNFGFRFVRIHPQQ